MVPLEALDALTELLAGSACKNEPAMLRSPRSGWYWEARSFGRIHLVDVRRASLGRLRHSLLVEGLPYRTLILMVYAALGCLLLGGGLSLRSPASGALRARR